MGTGLRHAAACGLLLSLGACATNPVTGRRELSLISESQEIQMGKQASAADLQRVGVRTGPSVQTVMSRLDDWASGNAYPRNEHTGFIDQLVLGDLWS